MLELPYLFGNPKEQPERHSQIMKSAALFENKAE